MSPSYHTCPNIYYKMPRTYTSKYNKLEVVKIHIFALVHFFSSSFFLGFLRVGSSSSSISALLLLYSRGLFCHATLTLLRGPRLFPPLGEVKVGREGVHRQIPRCKLRRLLASGVSQYCSCMCAHFNDTRWHNRSTCYEGT